MLEGDDLKFRDHNTYFLSTANPPSTAKHFTETRSFPADQGQLVIHICFLTTEYTENTEWFFLFAVKAVFEIPEFTALGG